MQRSGAGEAHDWSAILPDLPIHHSIFQVRVISHEVLLDSNALHSDAQVSSSLSD